MWIVEDLDVLGLWKFLLQLRQKEHIGAINTGVLVLVERTVIPE